LVQIQKNLLKLCKYSSLDNEYSFSAKLFRNAAQFGGFTSVFSSAYKVVLCLMRRWVSHNDKINAPVAGFISALSVAFETNTRRSLFTVLVASRCIDSILNYMQAEGYISDNRNLRYFLLWLISSTFCGALHIVRPELINRGLLKFYVKWTMRTPGDEFFVSV